MYILTTFSQNIYLRKLSARKLYCQTNNNIRTFRTFLYLVFVLFLGATCKRATLATDYMIAVRVSAFQSLLLAGIYVSSISSCLGAMYGTPRVLQRYVRFMLYHLCRRFKFYLLFSLVRIGNSFP